MPPPPAATTTKPASIRASTAGASRISRGSGEATIRRQPFSPRSSQVSPCSIMVRASASPTKRPIGLVGVVKPGSSASTRVRVTSAAVRRDVPRSRSASSRAFISTKPSVAWVCAPHQSSGTGGTTAAASSFLTSRLPTCGPLPWVITTSTGSGRVEQVGDRGHRDPRGGDLVLGRGRGRRGWSWRCRPAPASPSSDTRMIGTLTRRRRPGHRQVRPTGRRTDGN